MSTTDSELVPAEHLAAAHQIAKRARRKAAAANDALQAMRTEQLTAARAVGRAKRAEKKAGRANTALEELRAAHAALFLENQVLTAQVNADESGHRRAAKLEQRMETIRLLANLDTDK